MAGEGAEQNMLLRALASNTDQGISYVRLSGYVKGCCVEDAASLIGEVVFHISRRECRVGSRGRTR